MLPIGFPFQLFLPSFNFHFFKFTWKRKRKKEFSLLLLKNKQNNKQILEKFLYKISIRWGKLFLIEFLVHNTPFEIRSWIQNHKCLIKKIAENFNLIWWGSGVHVTGCFQKTNFQSFMKSGLDSPQSSKIALQQPIKLSKKTLNSPNEFSAQFNTRNQMKKWNWITQSNPKKCFISSEIFPLIFPKRFKAQFNY